MIYAFRDTDRPYNRTLTEFVSLKAFDAERTTNERALNGVRLNKTTAAFARDWVKYGGHHETALYVNLDGKVRRASDGVY